MELPPLKVYQFLVKVVSINVENSLFRLILLWYLSNNELKLIAHFFKIYFLLKVSSNAFKRKEQFTKS